MMNKLRINDLAADLTDGQSRNDVTQDIRYFQDSKGLAAFTKSYYVFSDSILFC